MFCPVCLRTSYCPCKSCVERWPDNSPRYIRIEIAGDDDMWDEQCPHCKFRMDMDWSNDYNYARAVYFNGSGNLSDIDLEKCKTNIYSSRLAINKSLDAELIQKEESYKVLYGDNK